MRISDTDGGDKDNLRPPLVKQTRAHTNAEALRVEKRKHGREVCGRGNGRAVAVGGMAKVIDGARLVRSCLQTGCFV